MMADRDPLTHKVIGAAIEVHRLLGPGLLESAYEECLCHEMARLKVGFQRQVPLPVEYKLQAYWSSPVPLAAIVAALQRGDRTGQGEWPAA